MNLHEYLKPLDKEQLDAFARRCITSAGQLKQVAYGNRRPSAGLAINIERETGGRVVCEDLRPDIDWAYVRSTAKKAARAAVSKADRRAALDLADRRGRRETDPAGTDLKILHDCAEQVLAVAGRLVG